MPMRISGLMSGMDTETIISQLVEAKKTNLNKTKKAQLSLKYKQDAWKSLNTQILSLYNKTLSNMRFESSFVKKTSKVSNSSVVSVITGEGAMNSVQSLEVDNLAKSGYLTGGKLSSTAGTDVTGKTTLGELGFTGSGSVRVQLGGDDETNYPIDINENTTINSFISQLKEAGVTANFDEANGRIYVASKSSGEKNDFSLTAYDENGAKALDALGLFYYDGNDSDANGEVMRDYAISKYGSAINGALAGSGIPDVTNGTFSANGLSNDDKEKLNDAIKQVLAGQKDVGKKSAAEDARIYLNGVEYTSSSNTFAINGLTLNVTAKTAPGETVTITTEDDTQGIYDMVKNFFKEYNSLINQMDKLYNAESASEYEPLLSEEKEGMTDSEIEEWETKVKDSILRKDATLSSFSSAMKEIMMSGVEVNGKKMYLSNFGINTLSYFTAAENEKNAYHIDGDEDDGETSGNADKLKSMIANDPDTVVSFFTQLSKKLYDKMTELTGTSDYSSFNTAYDDKKMKKEYDDYTLKIKELEDKLADYEDKWYAKFAAMETALSKMQQNASAVTALLGGSS